MRGEKGQPGEPDPPGEPLPRELFHKLDVQTLIMIMLSVETRQARDCIMEIPSGNINAPGLVTTGSQLVNS